MEMKPSEEITAQLEDEISKMRLSAEMPKKKSTANSKFSDLIDLADEGNGGDEEVDEEVNTSAESPKSTYDEDDANSCSSIDSLNTGDTLNMKNSSDEMSSQVDSNLMMLDDKEEQLDELKDLIKKDSNSTLIKRTQLKSLIHELYNLNDCSQQLQDNSVITTEAKILVESVMEKLPPGKNLKNSILLAWKKRYFKLNSNGVLSIHELNDNFVANTQPIETYNLMGARVTYEQNNVINVDDCRGNYLVFRCLNDADETLHQTWTSAINAAIIDRCETLWVRPNVPLSLGDSVSSMLNKKLNKRILIVDIGTCSIRAGLFNNEPKLPEIFIPTVCSRDPNQINRLRVGFDAFDSLLSSSAPSTIDLNKAQSMWSLNSTSSGHSRLVFPLKNKTAIDKSIDMDSIDEILAYVVDTLNVTCEEHQIVVITPQRFSDKVNIQFLNMLLTGEKYRFEAVTLINQSLLSLYSYSAALGVVVNLSEKIDITPICNGISFQSGVTNLAYGGSAMSEYLNSYVSRGHINYVNDMEQFFVRFVKEKACYAALDYKQETQNSLKEKGKFKLELQDQINDFKKIELPESARFNAVEGLFNPEIWGIDGQGIHKLIHKAIQSSSMDLRREMARNIYLCGGMSRIPGLKDRLEKELKALLPPALTVKVNCSEYSYHSAYLGAFKFIQQPEYSKLFITRQDWATENVNCLRKWRMI